MILFSAFVLLYFSALVYLTFYFKSMNVETNYVPFLIFTIIILWFPVRLILWNKFGEESIIIN